MKKLWKNEHFKSFLHTFVTELFWDMTVGGAIAHIFVEKDFSKTALYAVGYAVFRTLFRVIREEYFKKKPVSVPGPQADLPNAP